MNQAIQYLDNQIGRIWDAMEYRKKNFKEDWIIYITTDHGRDALTGKGHGGQTDRERGTWLYTNNKHLNPYFHSGLGAIVDIPLSISRDLGIKIPTQSLWEFDGAPLTKEISISNPKAVYNNGKIELSWKSWDKTGKVKIYLSTTNHFKTGGKDEYQLIKKADLIADKTIIDVKNQPSKFYKIIIKAPYNTVNTWVIVK